VGGKKEDWGVISKTAIFSLPSIQNREGGHDLAADRQGASPAALFSRPEIGAKRRGRQGESTPRAHLVLGLLVKAAPRAGRAGGGGARGGGAPVCKREESSVMVVRGEPGSCRSLFIGGIRRFGGRFFELEELLSAGNGGSGRSQRGLQAVATRCRTAVAVVLEGTARAGPLWRPWPAGAALTGRLGQRERAGVACCVGVLPGRAVDRARSAPGRGRGVDRRKKKEEERKEGKKKKEKGKEKGK
jgi:hypothetical protein